VSDNTSGTNDGAACGGGLFVADGTNTVTDSTIAGNAASSPAASSQATGGALFADVTTDHVTITGSTLSGNQAEATGDQGSAAGSAIFNRQGVPLDLANRPWPGTSWRGTAGRSRTSGR